MSASSSVVCLSIYPIPPFYYGSSALPPSALKAAAIRRPGERAQTPADKTVKNNPRSRRNHCRT
jgi:hypothetical protein